ncbi:MAG: hypothetical protein ACRC14_20500, partial [Paracoccaceae bacterium]
MLRQLPASAFRRAGRCRRLGHPADLKLLTEAYRIGQNSIVAAFEFTFAFWGILWGWLFWSDLPDVLGWIGTAGIIGGGSMCYATTEPQKRHTTRCSNK